MRRLRVKDRRWMGGEPELGAVSVLDYNVHGAVPGIASPNQRPAGLHKHAAAGVLPRTDVLMLFQDQGLSVEFPMRSTFCHTKPRPMWPSFD
ncbi:unnamed protein product [Arctogadus glacialis]